MIERKLGTWKDSERKECVSLIPSAIGRQCVVAIKVDCLSIKKTPELTSESFTINALVFGNFQENIKMYRLVAQDFRVQRYIILDYPEHILV